MKWLTWFSMVSAIAVTAFSFSSNAASGRFVSVKDGRFLDPEGRQLLLHGMSVISKSPKDNYQSWQGPGEFADLRDCGMNCIRLGILWDGIEPEPGKYDDAYLKKVDARIQWAKEQGIYVFLDMHQDLFSVLYSDGAPEWATLHGGAPHVTGPGVWSDAYFTSPAVQAAFDNFWANVLAPDGMGVQDHFALAWRHVAARYAGDPGVIGYDLFNEPNCGSLDPQAQLAGLAKLAEILTRQGTPTSPADLAGRWLSPEGRSQLMTSLRDMNVYVPVIDATEPLFRQFERDAMMPMFNRVARAIREVDKRHILFLETSMSANMGIRSGIEPVADAGGARDPQQAYAPHAYDIVVDTPDIASASTERIALIFGRHAETARRLNMPMIVGEWGAYGGASAEILPAARAVVREFEKTLSGDIYWEFGPYVRGAAYFEVLCRPIPAVVAGVLESYASDPEAKTFTCSWSEDGTLKAPTRIYLPGRFPAGSAIITLQPLGTGYTSEPTRPGSPNRFLLIPPSSQPARRTLEVKLP